VELKQDPIVVEDSTRIDRNRCLGIDLEPHGVFVAMTYALAYLLANDK
jgi:hypothetical protein